MKKLTETLMGSLWRRWDLHLHAPGTKLNNAFGDPSDETVWDRYLDALENSPVTVFGITDYFCCDTFFEVERRFRAKYPDSERVFLPNLELRLSESISKSGGHPHIHVIFELVDGLCDQEKIARFLTNLETQNIDNADTKLRCTDLKTETDFAAATVSLDALKTALSATFGERRPYLIAFPANNDGLRSTDTTSLRKVALADRIDRTCDFFFGTEKNRDFLLRTDRYKQGESAPKPVVSGSDAHSFEDRGAYLTQDIYQGKHGRSRRLLGLDPQNSNAEPRAIVIHAAWYVCPQMVRDHGKLGRSEGCFAFSDDDLSMVLDRLGRGRLIYADKLGTA